MTDKASSQVRGTFDFYVPKDKLEITTRPMGGRSITAKIDHASEAVKIRFEGSKTTTFFLNPGDTKEIKSVDGSVIAHIKKLTNDNNGTASGIFETEG